MAVSTIKDLREWIKQFPDKTEIYLSSQFTTKQQFHFHEFDIKAAEPQWKYIKENVTEAEPPKLALGVYATSSSLLPSAGRE